MKDALTVLMQQNENAFLTSSGLIMLWVSLSSLNLVASWSLSSVCVFDSVLHIHESIRCVVYHKKRAECFANSVRGLLLMSSSLVSVSENPSHLATRSPVNHDNGMMATDIFVGCSRIGQEYCWRGEGGDLGFGDAVLLVSLAKMRLECYDTFCWTEN